MTVKAGTLIFFHLIYDSDDVCEVGKSNKFYQGMKHKPLLIVTVYVAMLHNYFAFLMYTILKTR